MLFCPRCHKLSVENNKCLVVNCGWRAKDGGRPRYSLPGDYLDSDPVSNTEDALDHMDLVLRDLLEKLEQPGGRKYITPTIRAGKVIEHLEKLREQLV